ncbi:hypothetical protein D3C85_1579950 [compost metagenome]
MGWPDDGDVLNTVKVLIDPVLEFFRDFVPFACEQYVVCRRWCRQAHLPIEAIINLPSGLNSSGLQVFSADFVRSFYFLNRVCATQSIKLGGVVLDRKLSEFRLAAVEARILEGSPLNIVLDFRRGHMQQAL